MCPGNSHSTALHSQRNYLYTEKHELVPVLKEKVNKKQILTRTIEFLRQLEIQKVLGTLHRSIFLANLVKHLQETPPNATRQIENCS